jgi:hypothetical protein
MEPKFEYTEGNHFKWGWGDEWYGNPNPSKQYKVHLGYTKRPWGTLREEAVNVAKLIASKATKPIIVGLSGGTDSQMACLSFIEARVPFTVIICRYRYSTGEIVNEHDIAVAYDFCKKHNITYQELEIDIDLFFNTRAKELATTYCMPKAETILQTVAMDHVGKDYCYIMAGGDVIMSTVCQPAVTGLDLKIYDNRFSEPCWIESPVPILQHMIANEYEGTSKFWLYTPELIAAYLHDRVTQDFLATFDILMDAYMDRARGHKLWELYHWFYKPMMTFREFPEMVRTKKYTGYENLYVGADSTPSRISVYESLLNTQTIKKLGSKRLVVCPITKLIEYITTEHTEDSVLLETKFA